MKIGIGNDHVGITMKNNIMEYLRSMGHEIVNYGTDSEERFDYPISAKKVSIAILNGEIDRGILICGTGVGMGIAANKFKGIRCVTCSEPYSALLSRQHNNTNVLSLGSRVIGIELAKMIVDIWLTGEYEDGRHQRRLDMIREIEDGLFNNI